MKLLAWKGEEQTKKGIDGSDSPKGLVDLLGSDALLLRLATIAPCPSNVELLSTTTAPLSTIVGPYLQPTLPPMLKSAMSMSSNSSSVVRSCTVYSRSSKERCSVAS
jgi:hypothetical protein